MPLLLDEILPRFDVRERHTTTIQAPAERVYQALWTTDFGESRLVRLLLGLRAFPARLLTTLMKPRPGARRSTRRRLSPLTLRRVVEEGFSVLAEMPPHEVVLGIVGAFWRLRGDRLPADLGSFRRPQPPRTARAAWSFRIDARPDGTTVLSTETRVACSDSASRWRFRIYWLVVRPGSGLIRRAMLRSVRRAAEGRV